MKQNGNKIKKAILLSGFLFTNILTALADETQDKFNHNHFRTPEAASFMKYGEESVNKYTGTADISVPLYTIKSKDIEIPLVLRYDASGIKVEQEASWVGLGWNLMVGGCINYVCAGAYDQHTNSCISNQTWTEYLTNMKTPDSNGTQYFNYSTDNINTWMESVPHSFAFDPPYVGNLSMDMQNYLMWGYGERDFYSVNILGKSFKFFIDPATLNPYLIGEAGEEYRIEPQYTLEERTGIGNQPDVEAWTITDSNGYVYCFSNSDTTSDSKGNSYKFCWYLTEIHTPSGENVVLSYTSHKEWGRKRMTESYSILGNSVSVGDQGYGRQGYSNIMSSGWVRNSYVSEITTSNQKVAFITSESEECSGRKLDAITVKSNDSTLTKKFVFSYSTFGCSGIGGNYAPATNANAELRLKLDNVKDIACDTFATDTLTTSFCYNSLNLPSKKSCAQDYWGYYNGKENSGTSNAPGNNGHTMLPTPQRFMSNTYTDELGSIKGANRFCNENYMQAAMLNKVVYPTGGSTIYEYEANRIPVHSLEDSQKFMEMSYSKIDASICYSPYSSDTWIFDQSNQQKDFTLQKTTTFDLYYHCSGIGMDDTNMSIIFLTDSGVVTIPLKFKSSNDHIFVESITWPPGDYRMIITPPDRTSGAYSASCQLRWMDTDQIQESDYYMLCGGLRIKKTCNYDNDGKTLGYTSYDYNNSGVLLNRIKTIDSYYYKYLKSEPNGLGPNTIYSTHYLNGYTITTGQTQFFEFFASCNPGNVGYSKVAESRYNANDSLERRIITSYINHAPQSMNHMDYYTRFDNGKILREEIMDADGNTMQKVENNYRFHDSENDDEKDRWYSTNMIAIDQLVTDPAIQYYDPNDYNLNHRFQVWKYPYILSRVDLVKTTTTENCSDGSTIVNTKEYSYNRTNHLVSQIDESTSLSNQTKRTKIIYSADGMHYPTYFMMNAFRLNDIMESKEFLVTDDETEEHIRTDKTSYDNSPYFLPVAYSTSIGNNPIETRARYSYDAKNNICSVETDGTETVYVWSYSGQYPIAKIEGLSYSEVQNVVDISYLLNKVQPSEEDMNTIRSSIIGAGGHITTYTYRPLVGITSQTLPNGMTTRYEYDGYGRLVNIIDNNGSIISSYNYNYKGNE